MAATESIGSTSRNRDGDLKLAQANGIESVGMAERIQSFDWSQTAVGPIERWPSSLRTMVSFMLTDRFPKLLWWGPDYISIYNDAYRPILGAKHPWALGKPVRECWAEIWPVLKPLIDTPFQGGPGTWIEDFELEIHRRGFTEETHFTVAYSPVPDHTVPSGIGGVMATVHEITDKVIGERRIIILRDLGTWAAKAKTAEEACALSAETLAEHPKDIPFAMLYLADADGERARLIASTGIDTASEDFRLPSIDLAQREGCIWPLAASYTTEQTQIVRDLPSKFQKVPSGPWSDLPHTALVLPIRGASGHKFAGFLIAGVSARIELDEKYKGFLELAASQIGSAIVNARAYQEERKRAEALTEISEELAFELAAMTRMQQLSTSLGQADGLNHLLGQIIEAAIEITCADKGNIQLFQNGVPHIVQQRGFSEPFLTFFNGVEGGQAACGIALERGERVIVEDIAHSSLYERTQARDVMLAADVKACQSTPLISRSGKVLGTLSTHYSTAPRTPADRDLRLLDILARQAADLIERQQAETGLRKSEEQLRLATEYAEIGFWDVDPIHDILVWPASVKTMFGISPDVPVTMRDFYHGLHPNDRAATSEAYAAAADPNRRALYDVEYRTIGKEDGRVRWVAAKGRGVFDEDGRCIRLIGTALDITERKNTETALVESEERLRFGLDAGRMVAWECDLATGVSRLSGNAAEILGLDTSDAEDPHRFVHADDQARVLAVRDAALAGEGEYDVEYRLALNNGQVIWVVDRARVLRDAKGRPERMVGVIMDVTARKTAEESLRHSEARFRQLADSMPQMVWTAEPDGVIDYLNQRWKEYTDVPEQDFYGAGDWAAFLHPEDLPRVAAYWIGHVSTGEPADIEFRLRRRDGMYRWVLTRAVPLCDAQGCIVKWFGTATDIDDQKRTEEELRRANRDLEQFAFSASHDLQEPIRNVAIYSQLFNKRYAGKLDKQADKFLGYITEGAQRMGDLVSDLLAYTQAAATDNEVLKPVSTEDALRKVLSNLQGVIQESNAQVTYDPLPAVGVKEVHLQQLLQNLIGNAIKYRKDTEPPRIHAAAGMENGMWRFSIADNGIGIEPQFHDRVFGLFKRLHASGGKYPGTGIGLAICQKIVERYGGRIWLESEPDEGTTFYFTLPEA